MGVQIAHQTFPGATGRGELRCILSACMVRTALCQHSYDSSSPLADWSCILAGAGGGGGGRHPLPLLSLWLIKLFTSKRIGLDTNANPSPANAPAWAATVHATQKANTNPKTLNREQTGKHEHSHKNIKYAPIPYYQ